MSAPGPKRKAEEGAAGPDGDAVVQVLPLGAGQEVGRSCIIVRYGGKMVMLDCGVHPGFFGLASLPFFDEVDLAEVDVMLVTHFHLDHCAAVPYVTGHTPFRGRVLMTHATKAIVHTLLKDFVKVSRGGSGEGLYTEKDLDAAMEKTEVVDFHQTVDVGGVRVTAYRAGHVLGAAMFQVEIGGMRLLYTGDYSRIPDRHMPPADLPDQRPHIVVVESTYGVSRHLPREEREQRFVERIHTAVARGGRVLLPVVALGRAQELLLILEEYWERHPELHGVPIYQASGLARRAMGVYQAYIEMMNDDIKAAFTVANPFQFRHISHLKSAAQFDDVGPCVVMATPSMLQSGVSRELFEAWCEDPRNCVVIADFAVQGTLARDILGNPSEVMTRNGVKVPLRMQVDAISFSAHADFPQTSEFLDALQPPHVVLVHGEATEMARLKKALEQHAAALGIPRTLYMPKVTQPVLIEHRAERAAKVVGRLGEKAPSQGGAVRGLLVQGRGGERSLLHADDLPRFTKLHPGRVVQRQALALHRPFSEVRLALEMMFEGTQGAGDLGRVDAAGSSSGGGSGGVVLRIGGTVTLAYQPSSGGGAANSHGSAVLEWVSGSDADMVADAVVAVVLQAAGAPPGMEGAEAARRKALAAGDTGGVEAAELSILTALLGAQFGPARVDEDQGLIFVEVDGQHVVIANKGGAFKVECSDAALRGRVERALGRMRAALSPLDLGDLD
ncbi:Cleavage and polyadenylation specificity factor subunit 3 [Micractinium conductrix]|uniref:Cleavage and polyadenylation specificity factor subunit 3 n=1 Tax=Micractinium conductrix TaxID=554055 RepID=A0A2P6V6P1_9CHLO|nr:Cleavage and polyadenylation specificity factor subunit 3 [Micractinium conductrix]|eukprot:PSC69750.1 Cleavage and polyadenylation specificity factor subunit 3 [Micractinium conductrix]